MQSSAHRQGKPKYSLFPQYARDSVEGLAKAGRMGAMKAKFFETAKELLRVMEWHVKREVKHYKSDFEYDKVSVMNMDEGLAGYYWITRDCGTWWIKADAEHADLLNAVLAQWAESRPYFITKGHNGIYTLQPVRYIDAVKHSNRLARESCTEGKTE